MSPQVEEKPSREEENQEDGVLLHHNCDSLRSLGFHLLLPDILVDHGRSGLLRKVGFSWRKTHVASKFLTQVLSVLEEEESAVHPETE